MAARDRVVLAAIVAVGLILTLGLVAKCDRDPFDPVDGGRGFVSGQYVGQTREEVLERLGDPSHEWSGHYGKPPLEYARAHDPALSMTYVRRSGGLYLCFEKAGGRW